MDKQKNNPLQKPNGLFINLISKRKTKTGREPARLRIPIHIQF